MPAVARKDDQTKCPKSELRGSNLPPMGSVPVYISDLHVGGPLNNALPVCLEVDGRPVIRLGDEGNCAAGSPAVVFEGAVTFTVCGLPVARVGDHTDHAGIINAGSPHFVVGGPSFALPANFIVQGTVDFKNKVIRDLYLLSTTRTGKVVIDTLAARGFPLVIQYSRNGNNCAPDNTGAFRPGAGSESTVKYDPESDILEEDDAGQPLHHNPQSTLGHELIHAYHAALGTYMQGNEDPKLKLGPPTQPDIELEEEQTIGVGQFTDIFPSENSLRLDLGLPHRGNHYGHVGIPRRGWNNTVTLPDGSKLQLIPFWHNDRLPPVPDIRPGDC